MDAKTLIDQVRECKMNNWKNSDLGRNSEKMLVAIADHFDNCEECRTEFDAQAYPETTLIDFEDRLSGTVLSDWIHTKRGKGRGKSIIPTCPHCKQDLKRSYETAEDWKKGKSPYGWHCKKDKYQIWD